MHFALEILDRSPDAAHPAKADGFNAVTLTVGTDDSAASIHTRSAGLKLACLVPASDGNDFPAAVVRCIDLAAEVSCSRVLLDPLPPHERMKNTELLALADQAAERGVTLLIENHAPFAAARDLWQLLERLDHPALAAALDAERSAQAPGVTVPMLNSRIRIVHVGIKPTMKLIHRLRGIGFSGWVVVRSASASVALLARLHEEAGDAARGKK